jgi:hypothetical protein
VNGVHINELVDRYFDCDLAGDDRTALERTLLASPQARALFWQKAETHSLLRKWGRTHWGRVAATTGGSLPAGGRRQRTGWCGASSTGAAAAAAVVAIGLSWAAINGWWPATTAPQPGGGLSTPKAVEPQAFAVLTAAFEPVWADSNVGLMLQRGSLPPGPLELVSGRVELLFAAGGTAVIEGPALVEPIAADALRLSRGSIRCQCPQPGTELRVETPSSTITDLGTEFAVSVGSGARTRVGVIQGKVRVDTSGASKLIAAGEALSIDRDGRTADDIGFWKDEARKATLIPFDEPAFAAGRNALQAPSFELAADASEVDDGVPPVNDTMNFTLGPWKGTAGHVELISLDGDRDARAIRIRAKGNPFWPLVWQQVDDDTLAGKTVMASIHASCPHDDPLVDPQRAIVKLAFLDAAGRQFASAERHFLRGSGVSDRFVAGKLAAEAPPGTVAVRFQVLLTAAGRTTGSIVIDDAKLVITVRP